LLMATDCRNKLKVTQLFHSQLINRHLDVINSTDPRHRIVARTVSYL
jgi:hypothetical protein